MDLIKKPSAWVPIGLSLVVVGSFLIGMGLFGAPTREPDEGLAARLFQFWLALEVLLIAFFAARWLSQAPQQAFPILGVQITAVLAGCAPVYLLHL